MKPESEVRQRIINAAAPLFAESGFHSVGVRQIALHAQVNVASINYHFGDKEALYVETFRYCMGTALALFPPKSSKTTARERISEFAESFLLRVTSDGAETWHAKMISHEMIRPTPALDVILKEEGRQLVEVMMEIVTAELGPHADPTALWNCWMSIIGQIVFHHHCSPIIKRVNPDLRYSKEQIRRLADHIAIFSVAGLKAIKESL